jgi:hypothetical protein
MNYYRRMVDSRKQEQWENIVREADRKRGLGEETGPLPQRTFLPKRRYDILPGSTPRRRRGPALGFFNTDSVPQIIQADADSQLSLMLAQEAQIEPKTALRVERELREQQRFREDVQVRQLEELRREREAPAPFSFQSEPISSMHQPNSIRKELPTWELNPTDKYQYGSAPGSWQTSQDASRQLPSISHTFPPPPQEHAPPYQQHGLPFFTWPPEPVQHLADRQAPEHAPAPSKRESIRKTSNIMSLLNDDPSAQPSRPMMDRFIQGPERSFFSANPPLTSRHIQRISGPRRCWPAQLTSAQTNESQSESIAESTASSPSANGSLF